MPLRQPYRPFAVDADRVHLERGGADENRGIEIGGLQGQRSAFVLQQHGGLFAGLLDDLRVGFDGLRRHFVLGLAVQVAETDDLIEDASGGAGDGGLVHRAVLESLGHLFGVQLDAPVAAASAVSLPNRLLGIISAEAASAIIVVCRMRRLRHGQRVEERGERLTFAAGHLHVQAGVDEVDRVGRAPIRGHEALEADLVAQNPRQRGLVAAGKTAVDAVVGAHDGRDAGPDGRVEWSYIHFMQRLAVHEDIAAVRVVGHIVLDLRHDVLRLDALDLGHRHLGGQERVFAKGVVAAAELEVAVDVHKGLQRDVDAQRAVFAADRHAVLLGQLAAECGGHAHGGGFALRGMAREHSRRSIGKAQPRNAEARNAAEIAGLALVDRWIFQRAVNQRELFIERHSAQ